jgi:Flp pilus assembly pilin Flp
MRTYWSHIRRFLRKNDGSVTIEAGVLAAVAAVAATTMMGQLGDGATELAARTASQVQGSDPASSSAGCPDCPPPSKTQGSNPPAPAPGPTRGKKMQQTHQANVKVAKPPGSPATLSSSHKSIFSNLGRKDDKLEISSETKFSNGKFEASQMAAWERKFGKGNKKLSVGGKLTQNNMGVGGEFSIGLTWEPPPPPAPEPPPGTPPTPGTRSPWDSPILVRSN